MSDRDSIALTIYGEARGEGFRGRLAVACVLRNRLKAQRWGLSYFSVCHYPKQFSCWNVTDPNRAKLLALEGQPATDPILLECYTLADVLLNESTIKTLSDATHYYADSIAPPKWAATGDLVASINHHKFFEGVA